MKKIDAKPGTKVLASSNQNEHDDEYVIPFRYDEYGFSDLLGVIRSKKAKPGHVWVKWIEGDYFEDEEEIPLKTLTLESDRSQIEKEFKKVAKEVKEKMKEAARIVEEAGDLADTIHTTLENMYDATSPLVNAMDNNGWRSSSWGCFQ